MKIFRRSCPWLCVFVSLAAAAMAFGAVPSITAFYPTSGAAGASVTISGHNFGSNNIVYFGPVQATVVSAVESNLTVTVPNGAMYGPITVTVGGSVAYSRASFEPTFAGGGANIDISTFAPRVDIPVSSGPNRMVVADLNGDGKPDLIVANIYTHQITLLQNVSTSGSLATNSFAAPMTLPFSPTGDDPYWLAVGDVDGDGKIDLVVPAATGQIFIYRNISSGGALTTNSFAAPVAFTVGNTPRNCVVRDLDGDGRPDIVVANLQDQTVSILKNIGVAGVINTNSFAHQFVLPVGVMPQDLAVGDLDGDGKPDLAVSNYRSLFLCLYRNVSVSGTLDTNSFAARVDLPAPMYCNSIVLGDMDGDGKLDLIMGTAEGNNKVSIFGNIATPGTLSTNSFSPPLDFPAPGWVSTVSVGDVNGDGKPDLAVVDQMASTLSLFQNVGTGSFGSNSLAPRMDYSSGLNPYSASIVDLDGDGRPDIAFVNVYDNSVSLYRNIIGTPEGPVITQQPTNKTVAVGGNSSFSVTAVGTLPLYYQWWKGAGSIPGATNSTLIITNAQLTNAGTYYVVVSGPGGTVTSSNATLTVTNAVTNLPPTITTQPTNQTVAVGGFASFQVGATGTGPLSYQWAGPAGVISNATGAILTLTNIQPSQAGGYYVTVSNPYGATNSRTATLTVTNGGSGGSPHCTPVPSGIAAWWPGEGNGADIINSNNAILESGVTFAPGEVNQAFQLLNYTNGYMHVPASPSLNIGANSNGFTIEGWIKVSDVSGYHPIAEWYSDTRGVLGVQLWISSGGLFGALIETNGTQHLFTSPSGTVVTDVFQHVALTYNRTNGLAVLYVNGTNVAQSSVGSFVPETRYNFWIGHRPFDVPGDITYGTILGGSLDELSLYRRPLSQGEIAAIYNAGSAGKCSGSGGVTNFPPTITSQPTNQTVSVGGFASFQVGATGSAPLSYQWHGPSGVISNVTGAILTLTNIQLSQAGGYYATVSNPYGSTNSATATLTVTGGSGGSTNCTPVPSSIVAWWPGEYTGQDIINGNNAILESGVTFGPGKVIEAFELLNYTNGFMHVPASSNLNVGTSTAGFTIEGWIKVSDLSGYHPIVEWYGTNRGSVGVQLWIEGGALVGTLVETNGVAHVLTLPAGALAANTFQHVAMTYNRFYGVETLYVNGTNVSEAAVGRFAPQTTYDLWIGHRPFDMPGDATYGATLGGSLDELSLYARELSQSEIVAICKAGSAGKCSGSPNYPPTITSQPTNQTVSVGGFASFQVGATGSAPLSYQWHGPSGVISNVTGAILTLTNIQLSQAGGYYATVSNPYGSTNSATATLTVTGGSGGTNCTPPPPALAAWWPGEGNGVDVQGGNNAILESGVTFGPGEVNQAFQLLNYTNGFAHVPASPSLNVGVSSNGFTMEGWIKAADVSGYHPIAEWYGDVRGASGVNLWISWGGLMAGMVGTDGSQAVLTSPPGTLFPNVFQHVAMTYNRIAGTLTLYVNGTNVAQSNIGSFIPQTTYNFWMGHRPFDVPGDVTYGTVLGGSLDELSLYNRSLSQSEIAAIYNAGSAGKCSGGSGNSAPVITKQPTNHTVAVGVTTTFSITAVGSPTLYYQWHGPAGIISGGTNATLSLTNVQPSDAGAYFAVVTNSYGSATSSNGVLTVSLPTSSIQVVSTNATAGTSFAVSIALSANGTENGLSFSFNFDPAKLAYTDIELGGGASDALLLPNVGQAGSGKIGVQLALPTGETFSPGIHEIVRIVFTAPVLTGTQALVTAVNFTNQPLAELVSDAAGHSLSNIFVNGSVTLSPTPLEGDAAPVPAGNGAVDLFDWVQVGRFVAGLDAITNGALFQKVDCAPRASLGDGQLKVTDWVQAGRYAAGLDPLTVAGGPTGPVTNRVPALQPRALTPREVSIGSGAVVKGLTMTLPVRLQAQGDETALAFSLSFDPTVVQYVNTVKGSAASSAVLNVNASDAASGRIAIVLSLPAGGSHFPAGLEEVVRVTFAAVNSAASNTVSFADQPVPRAISDANASELSADYLSSSIVIKPQPNVAMSYGGKNSMLSWPIWAGDFTLQAAGSLTPPITWTNVPVTFQTNGDNIQIALPTPDKQIFFRLYHP